ncbi:amino acid adenylation protein [Sporanaerobium hydrogeniformans]|uniref:Amino acid adenylation protein n=1 Tax=Sporanaerobium hydrogeniformans TaxID=3072179 RepID=A0AC61DBM8_9FIRM|nr:non-ribosomal peptide synthetase [Sporanaerobium hydrogeniformans]PHV70428.1 amino acid adenylation protein [Sporanaerobium hydrogeniformans]
MINHVLNGKKRDTKNLTVVRLFEKQAIENQNKMALKFRDKTFTYKELNQKGNQVAHYLRSIGVKNGELVGIYLERSEQMIVVLLGILKAGAVYVPLDPTHPQERNNYIIKKSAMKWLMTHTELEGDVTHEGLQKICIDQKWEVIEKGCCENLDINYKESDLAYVIFTSGSTGKPKGVAIRHEGVANYLLCMRETLDLSGDERALATITITFDVSVSEIFLPLISGATLIFVGSEEVKDGMKLKALIDEEGITLMQPTPSTLYMLLDAGWKGNQRLSIVVGGEAWNIQLAKKLMEDEIKSLWNVYGPTETTIYSTIAKITSENTFIPLGQPIDQTTLYVLDEKMNPIEVGEEGELYIGGVGVAKGYLNNEELTRESFIQNPFGEEQERIYKTGDIIKRVDKETLAYIGRKDFQVKIRGFRIELGEIEKAILMQPGVSQAVVVAVTKDKDTRLCAYVKGLINNSLNTLEVRHNLEKLLPPYMIPNFIIALEEFPQTSNGKIDRKALMNQEVQSIETNDYVAPRTEFEQEIANLWEELLDIEGIGIKENFLELGGHSLMANRLIIRMNKSFGTTLTLLDILSSKLTIEDMARIVEDNLLSNLSEEELEELLSEVAEEEENG